MVWILSLLAVQWYSWAAEEYGLIGSREFVEQYTPALVERTVAYLNTDVCVSNNASIFAPHVAPVLKLDFWILLEDIKPFFTLQFSREKLLDATKAVPNYYDPTESYYDFWLRWVQEDGLEEPNPELPCEYRLTMSAAKIAVMQAAAA